MYCLDDCFCKQFSHNFQKRQSSKVSDIVRGQNYDILENGVRNPSKWHITLTLNTDGVSIFKTSRNGILLPVYMTVNKLSENSR